jgi:hypothetical protein
MTLTQHYFPLATELPQAITAPISTGIAYWLYKNWWLLALALLIFTVIVATLQRKAQVTPPSNAAENPTTESPPTPYFSQRL